MSRFSLRLTAFVLTTLQDADEADWREFLFIENGLLNKVALWLTQQQDRQTGAFSESAPFYDYNMRVRKGLLFNSEHPSFLETSKDYDV